MDKLVQEIIKPILEADSNIKKVIGVFGGRFQPFGPHHYATYKWLAKQVDEAYITTSNIKKPPRHPMNFKEKTRHMAKMGVPANRIVEEKSPYVADNLLKKFDSETTAVVYIFGAKDAGRLKGGKKKSGGSAYYQNYKKNKNNLLGFGEHGYFLEAPHVSVSVGGKEVSGTVMRELLGSPKIDDSERKKLFKQAFGYFDDGMYKMMTNKFSKLFESLNESKQEFVIWGIPPGKNSEEILYTKAKSHSEAKKVVKVLMDKHGVKKARIQILDLEQDPSTFWKTDKIFEFDIPIKVGDTVFMGKFKNKKVVIKSIDWNEKGDLLINGKSAMRFRIPKKPNIFDEFIQAIDIQEIINEVTTTSIVGIDDGPRYFYGNMKSYKKMTKDSAEKLGFQILNYILDSDKELEKYNTDYPDGPVGGVSFAPIGVMKNDGRALEHPDLTGKQFWNKYKKHITTVAQILGYKIIDWIGAPEDISDMSKTKKGGSREEPKVTEQFSKEWWKTQLIMEGGAAGHMNHPFDDKNLTFADLKNMVDLSLGGYLSLESGVSEKLDGQNLMVSWKGGKLVAARNRGHLKNQGKTALDINGITSKFQGRGDIRDAFVFAMKDLQKSIEGLSQKQKDKIFANGKNFMNLEIMWPSSANVLNYDVALLVFHGALEYDNGGNVIGQVKDAARILEGMIRQINAGIQKHFNIGKPIMLTIPKHQDFGKNKNSFFGKLNKLQNKFGLKDGDTMALYHQKWWEEFIQKQNSEISDKVLKGLVSRWAFFDKSYSVANMKKDITDDKFLDWVLKFDKNDHQKQVKENMFPFETLFFELGAVVLKNISGFLAANPDKTVQEIRKKVEGAIKQVQGGGDLKKMNKLTTQLKRIDAIGGFDSIVPSEGIVFQYKGNMYKLTGSFGPINQIIGLIEF